jgi:hypothetical protein
MLIAFIQNVENPTSELLTFRIWISGCQGQGAKPTKEGPPKCSELVGPAGSFHKFLVLLGSPKLLIN